MLPTEWTAEINYLANSDGSMTFVAVRRRPRRRCRCIPGLNRVFVRLSGARAIARRLAPLAQHRPALSVCAGAAAGTPGARIRGAIGSRSAPRCAVSMTNLRDEGLQVFREMLPGVLPDATTSTSAGRVRARTDGHRRRERLRQAVDARRAQPPRPQPRHAGHPHRAARHRRTASPLQIARTNGLTDEELAEVIYHASGYAGFPAANTARTAAEAIAATPTARPLDGERT